MGYALRSPFSACFRTGGFSLPITAPDPYTSLMANTDKAKNIGAIAVTCGLFVGLASIVAAGTAFWNHEWIGTGVCLGAAGLAFGLAANAVWRQ
jgi:hypothetical protein